MAKQKREKMLALFIGILVALNFYANSGPLRFMGVANATQVASSDHSRLQGEGHQILQLELSKDSIPLWVDQALDALVAECSLKSECKTAYLEVLWLLQSDSAQGLYSVTNYESDVCHHLKFARSPYMLVGCYVQGENGTSGFREFSFKLDGELLTLVRLPGSEATVDPGQLYEITCDATRVSDKGKAEGKASVEKITFRVRENGMAAAMVVRNLRDNPKDNPYSTVISGPGLNLGFVDWENGMGRMFRFSYDGEYDGSLRQVLDAEAPYNYIGRGTFAQDYEFNLYCIERH
jgi:hypothetical protein